MEVFKKQTKVSAVNVPSLNMPLQNFYKEKKCLKKKAHSNQAEKPL